MSEKASIWATLFGGSKKGSSGCCNMEIVEESESGGCCCGNSLETCEVDGTVNAGALTSVKVLGPGCKNCHALLGNVQMALKEIGSPLAVEYVTDMATVASYGIMSTPALVINEKVVSMGKVLKSSDVVKLMRKLGH